MKKGKWWDLCKLVLNTYYELLYYTRIIYNLFYRDCRFLRMIIWKARWIKKNLDNRTTGTRAGLLNQTDVDKQIDVDKSGTWNLSRNSFMRISPEFLSSTLRDTSWKDLLLFTTYILVCSSLLFTTFFIVCFPFWTLPGRSFRFLPASSQDSSIFYRNS